VALGSISAAIGGKFKVVDRWKEPVHVQIVAVAEPGSRKSAVFEELTRPLYDWQRERWPEERRRILEWESRERVLDAQLAQAEKKVQQTASTDIDEHNRQAAVLAVAKHRARRPFLTRVIADDITVEKAVSLLFEQGGSLAIMSAESAILGNIGVRYGNEPNYEVLLKGHAGESITVDRIGRGHEDIPHTCLTLCLTVQPAVLVKIGKIEGFLDRGGPARFLPVMLPDCRGYEDVDAPPFPQHLRDEWTALIERLLELPRSQNEQHPGPWALSLSPEAADAFRTFRLEVGKAMREGGALRNISDWAAKHAGAVLRLAGTLHVLEHDEPWEHKISLETMQAAIRVSEFFAEHAQVMYRGMAPGGGEAGAEILLAELRKLGPKTTRRGLHQKVKGRIQFRSAADLEPSLALLEDHNIICRRHAGKGTGPGRKSEHIYLNPRLEHLNMLKTPCQLLSDRHSEDSEHASDRPSLVEESPSNISQFPRRGGSRREAG
jgi:hypothetical protein